MYFMHVNFISITLAMLILLLFKTKCYQKLKLIDKRYLNKRMEYKILR